MPASVIKYKGIEFPVRPDALGISAALQAKVGEYSDTVLFHDRLFASIPEYQEIINIEDNARQIIMDTASSQIELKNSKGNKKKQAELKDIINANNKNLEKVLAELSKPRHAVVYNAMERSKRAYNKAFKQNPDNIKALAEAYLILPPHRGGQGEEITLESLIDFTKNDKDYFKLADDLFEQFFFTVNSP